jgi:hypothetical protein
MSIPILKLINLVILLVFLIGLIWYLRDLFLEPIMNRPPGKMPGKRNSCRMI